jgi:hypothetical protein
VAVSSYHHAFHRADRKRGVLRPLGVSLRMATYLVHVWWFPVRAVRVSWRRIRGGYSPAVNAHVPIGQPEAVSPREKRSISR